MRLHILLLAALLSAALGLSILIAAAVTLPVPVRAVNSYSVGDVADVAADENTPPMAGVPDDPDDEMPPGDVLTPAPAEPVAPAATTTATAEALQPVATTIPLAQPDATAVPTPRPLATATPRPTPVATPAAAAVVAPLPKTVNIMLLGSDRRPTQTNWRTDTIMVVMLDPQSKQAGVVSIHRDLWVNTPKGATKINTVDYGAGTATLKQVVGSLLGVPIDYYVRIEFGGVVKAIDTLGGVTLDVDCPFTEYYQDSSIPGGVRTLKVPAGRVKFTGQMALDYARSRLSSSVSDRMKRQMKVMLGVREKLLSPETFPRIPALWDQTRTLVSTDLPLSLIPALAKLGTELKLSDAHGLAVNERFGRVTYSPQKWWIIAPDVNAIRAAVRGIFSAPTLTTSIKGAGC
ncbi:MAG: LCP family protein [Chloroflexi bacterium]|nr:LCP family protein [Chloroflexota bacterium]